jgi:hypothetical protein
VIETASRASAECIAEALAEFGSELGKCGERWTVKVVRDDFEIAPLFAALEDCLTAYGIHSVQVNFGERRYLMAPSP